MQIRKKQIENAVVSTTAFSVNTTSEDFYAFEQTSWGTTWCFPSSKTIPNYDIKVSYDKGQNWFLATQNCKTPFSVLAPRVKLIARGDDHNSTTINIIQRELPPVEAEREFVYETANNNDGSFIITPFSKSFNLPNYFKAILIKDFSITEATIALQTSFDRVEWAHASEDIIVENKSYQEIDLIPNVIGNYFRLLLSNLENFENKNILLGLLIQETN